jgi:beta-glucosidase
VRRTATSLVRRLAAVLALAAAVAAVAPARAASWPHPPDAARVDALLARMTVDEKVAMIHGTADTTCASTAVGCVGQGGYVAGVPRLGVPPLRLGDGPAGLHLDRQATAMPAPVSLAATFDPGAATRYGAVIGREARALNLDVLLAPMINLVRVPIAGRNFETLGEDPLLAGTLGAAEVRAIQAQAIMADAKHFAGYSFEYQRKFTDVQVDDRTLHEDLVAPFEATIAAGVASVMCAYNRLDGIFSCSSDPLLNGILRGQLGFPGFVRSDGSATQAATDLLAGLDMEIPDGASFNQVARNAVEGTPGIPAQTWSLALDRAVRRILTEMDRFGMLDGTAPPRPSLAALAGPDRAQAEQLAIEGATLLTNRTAGRRLTLPLTPADLRGHGAVVMGPTAAAPMIGGRGSSSVRPFTGVRSPLHELAALAGPGAHISYVPGYDLDGAPVPPSALSTPAVPGERGLLRQQTAPGTVPDGLDANVDYTGRRSLPAGTAWRWTGNIAAPGPGRYQLKVEVAGQQSAALGVDGADVATLGGFPASGIDSLAQWRRTHGPEPLQQASATVDFAPGQVHAIDLRAVAGRAPLHVRLAWVTPAWPAQKIAEAAAAARRARTAIVFAYNESSEGGDRPGLALPGYQDALIDAVARANPHTIVVLNTGDPVTMPWLGRVAAVLEMWYPGQRGGRATAKLLLGSANPSGKLPVSFPAYWRQQPAYSADRSAYPGVAVPPNRFRTLTESEGIFGGYRWYDRYGLTPLFEFGHGLSYTSFAYSGLSVRASGGGFRVSFSVRNTGERAGAEVAQVYVGPPRQPPVPMARWSLAGFRRVTLRPGQSARVAVTIPRRALSYWSTAAQAWTVAAGVRPIQVGSSSRDARLRGVVRAAPGT